MVGGFRELSEFPAGNLVAQTASCLQRSAIPISKRPTYQCSVWYSVTFGAMAMNIEAIIDDFEFLDDWEDRYRYVIELGKTLEPLSDAEHSDVNKVRGCASQVWLVRQAGDGADPVLDYRGDSDAHIVRGLIAILLALYSGNTASAIRDIDAEGEFRKIGLRDHLTAQRSNGLSSMINRIRSDAEDILKSRSA